MNGELSRMSKSQLCIFKPHMQIASSACFQHLEDISIWAKNSQAEHVRVEEIWGGISALKISSSPEQDVRFIEWYLTSNYHVSRHTQFFWIPFSSWTASKTQTLITPFLSCRYLETWVLFNQTLISLWQSSSPRCFVALFYTQKQGWGLFW